MAPQSTQSNLLDFFSGTCTCVTSWAKPHFGQAKITVVINSQSGSFAVRLKFRSRARDPSIDCELVHSGQRGPENFAVH